MTPLTYIFVDKCAFMCYCVYAVLRFGKVKWKLLTHAIYFVAINIPSFYIRLTSLLNFESIQFRNWLLATWVKRSVNTVWIWHIICQINWALNWAERRFDMVMVPHVSSTFMLKWLIQQNNSCHAHSLTHTLHVLYPIPKKSRHFHPVPMRNRFPQKRIHRMTHTNSLIDIGGSWLLLLFNRVISQKSTIIGH